jgi:hypothetical protein
MYDEFLETVRSRGFQGPIADFSLCAVLLTALVGKYIRLRDTSALSGPFYAKAKLHDVWRIIPFVNMRSYVAHVKEWGIPLVQENESYTPPGLAPESLISLDPGANLINEDRRSAGLITALPLAGCLLWAVGIGSLADAKGLNEFSGAMMEAATTHRAH